jgi:leucyl-tRNA synthetase
MSSVESTRKEASKETAGYPFQTIENKWQEYWEQHKTFKTDSVLKDKNSKKFYCLDMFPYPSGSGLHIGHPLGYTGTDIYSRYKRMQGYEVLHPMGYDAFGLPAEQHALKTGEHPREITARNCERFSYQLRKIGLSYDWSRRIQSCDVTYYTWTQWIFLKLYNSYFDDTENKAKDIASLPIPEEIQVQGKLAVQAYQAEHRLAFYADAMVNWCPALGTVLANEEVINGKSERGGYDVIRKPMKQWMLRITKYAERLLTDLEGLDWPENIKEQQRNWIGKSSGCEIRFQIKDSDYFITVFTTRPETIYGATFLVIAPEHSLVDTLTTAEHQKSVELYKLEASKLSELSRTMENKEKIGVATGGSVINPLSGETIPVYIADYVLATYGTGAVMGVPAHDDRDFALAKKYSLPILPVLLPTTEDEAVKTAIIENKIVWSKPGVMLELPYSSAKELKLEGISNSEAIVKIIKYIQDKDLGRKVVQYKLRDWLFSRQRYWGEPIPIIHWEDGSVTAVPETDLPVSLPNVQDYKPSETGESPLAKAVDWGTVVDEKTGLRGKRETNTMPQWAGSCWYYLRFIDPHNVTKPWDNDLEKSWMPVDLYVGGAEHAVLHLLYARFWHKVLYDLEYVSTKEPFQKLFNQGFIVSSAYKNSKGSLIPVDEVEERFINSESKENVLYIHKTTGEEVTKITAKMSKSLKNVIDPLDIINEYGADTLRMYLMFMAPLDMMRPWDTKAINGVARFLKRVYSFFSEKLQNKEIDNSTDAPEATRELHKAIKKVSEDIEGIHFNTCISTLMDCLNKISGLQVSKNFIKQYILLLSPFAPHLSEELWEMTGNKKTLAYEQWPSYDPSLLSVQEVSVVVQVNGKKRALLNFSASINESELLLAVREYMQTTQYPVKDSDNIIVVYQDVQSENGKIKAPKLVSIQAR